MTTVLSTRARLLYYHHFDCRCLFLQIYKYSASGSPVLFGPVCCNDRNAHFNECDEAEKWN